MKDTAGPALNPLIKVINLVAMIFASVLAMPLLNGKFQERPMSPVGVIIAVLGIIAIIIAFWYSRKQSSFGREDEAAEKTPAAKK